jgi:hypothetical protein
VVTKAQTDRARPPSVERLLSTVRGQLDGVREHDALVAAARTILEEERARLQPMTRSALVGSTSSRPISSRGWKPGRGRLALAFDRSSTPPA